MRIRSEIENDIRQMIDVKFHRFIDEVTEDGTSLEIVLKRGFLFSTTLASLTYYLIEDYETAEELMDDVNRCLGLELMEVKPEAWDSAGPLLDSDVINTHPAEFA